MITIAPVSKGEQITLSKLSYTRQAGGLAEATPVGKRAITVSVDNLSSLAGMIKPGDYVDVIAMIPVPATGTDGKPTTQTAVLPLFQNVLVLAVGQEIGQVISAESRYKQAERSEPSPLITLALSPQEANLIAFVQEQSKIRLVLRSPADSKIEPVQITSWDTLFQYVMPKDISKTELPKEEGPFVEIYRGLNKERIILSK
jgi:pilus assembly protein CpaB